MTVPLTSEQLLASQYIESIYAVANATPRNSNAPRNTENLALWIDPDNYSNPKYLHLREQILGEAVYKTRLTGNAVDAQRRYYKAQIDLLMPAVEATARLWALKVLNSQEIKLGRLLLFVSIRAKDLSSAAAAVRQYARKANLPFMTADQTREITGQSPGPGTMPTRLLRVQYMNSMHTYLKLARDKREKDEEQYRYLYQLMAHPRGVQIVDAFAESADTGRSYASGTINECLTASRDMRADLGSDKELVWHFPPAISAGVAMLGLANRPAVTRFSLAWATTKKGRLESALEIAGNALLVLDLVGGPQAKAVGAVLNFVLAAIGTTVSFLRDVEQDQAATATAFAGNIEKLSEGSRRIGTILQGAATIVAALAVPGAISTITGAAGKTGAKLVTDVETLPNVRAGSEPRVIAASEVEEATVRATDQVVANKNINAAARSLDNVTERIPIPRQSADSAWQLSPKKEWTDFLPEAERRVELSKAKYQHVDAQANANRSRGALRGTGAESESLVGSRATRDSEVAGTITKRISRGPERPNFVPEFPVLPRAFDRYSDRESIAFYRAHFEEYPVNIQKQIAALPDRDATRGALESIDRAIRDAHTDEANRLAGFARMSEKPFKNSVKGASNEGGKISSVLTDNKTLTLIGQIRSGGTVEFDSVAFVESRIVETKLSFFWRGPGRTVKVKPIAEIQAQMKRQADFIQDWKKWSQVVWEIHDQDSYYLALAIKDQLVAIHPALAALIEIRDFSQ